MCIILPDIVGAGGRFCKGMYPKKRRRRNRNFRIPAESVLQSEKFRNRADACRRSVGFAVGGITCNVRGGKFKKIHQFQINSGFMLPDIECGAAYDAGAEGGFQGFVVRHFPA